MFPIYERATREGVGYTLESFSERFDEICADHLAAGRAKAFAFIFFDVDDLEFHRVLNDPGTFTHLDRLAGHDLTVFYIHGRGKRARAKFNDTFLPMLEIEGQAHLPCVVFFRVRDGNVSDIQIAQLEHPTLIHGFHELYSVLEGYLDLEIHRPSPASKGITWLKTGGKVIASQVFQSALGHYFGTLF